MAVDGFTVIDYSGGRALVQVSLHVGRNHIVRRLLDAVGHPVQRLVRTAIGPIRLGTSGRAGARTHAAELGELYRQLDL